MKNNVSLSEGTNSLPVYIKAFLWRFVRDDTSVRDFELWIYANENNMLRQLMNEESYLELVCIDYNDEKEINHLKVALYNFLIQYPEACLCNTFPDNTLLDPFTEGGERVFLESQIESLKSTKVIEAFSGKPPIPQSQWYHPGKLCHCSECNTWWFVLFEESWVDYYLIRLTKEDVDIISQDSHWPNENWPSRLRNWDAFLKIAFHSWNNLYLKNKSIAQPTHFLMGYYLNTSKYKFERK